ncbi:hypothetical protein TRP66_23390, partial [Pseudomonas sp. JDS28PS106]|uniref:hypothetical protein n=1 Tax=Pseudomonas sp. JDS28PS106 TaxID=2497235 RepID=UPI002FD45D40
MPTLKPRVQVTLEPATHEVIERFAALQKRTRGAVIAELLDSIAPPLARTVALLEAAQEAPKTVKDRLRSVADDLHVELVSLTGQAQGALGQLNSIVDGIPDGADDASTPVSVTRGSGTDTPHPRKRQKRSSEGSKPGVSEG